MLDLCGVTQKKNVAAIESQVHVDQEEGVKRCVYGTASQLFISI